MSHLELEIPKRELWGWFFFFPSLENSLISCQMTAIVFATREITAEMISEGRVVTSLLI